ncbi:MAG TPA: hypothetical protein VKV21_11675 [Solirubrobacteraceae bacterium]|nr:hypothetical protein [Solirubrobacteraceae bacterium]
MSADESETTPATRSERTPETTLDVDLLAASLRADASDLGTYAEALAAKLGEALPGAVRVQRTRAGLFGPKRVESIAVDTGSERFELRVRGGSVETLCARVSGGIVLKTEPVGTEEWLRRLSAALAGAADRSLTTRRALERLLDIE